MGQACTVVHSTACTCKRPGDWDDQCEPNARELDLDRRIELLGNIRLFDTCVSHDVKNVASKLAVEHYPPETDIIKQGLEGYDMYIVDTGECYALVNTDAGPKEVKQFAAGDYFGERALLREEPRAATVKSRTEVKLLKLSQEDYVAMIRDRQLREGLIRNTSLFETMTDEQVSKLAGLLERSSYRAGEKIVSQGAVGNHFYLLEKGECVATVTSGEGRSSVVEQEVKRYMAGDMFGEKALLEDAPRGATISAVSDVQAYTLSRADFEANLGPLSQLKAEQYLADPRKLIADFYRDGDGRGPRGTLDRAKLTPGSSRSSWFTVYRPCSRDSIAKMVGQVGVGKGLNVKGKSAKKNRLSGFVPFLQISDNDHKKDVEESPANARTKLFFERAAGREQVEKVLRDTMNANKALKIEHRTISHIDTYAPEMLGLDIPEPVLKEVFIMQPDLSPKVGWETGRDSEPAFMDMNLHAIRDNSTPEVVLFQFDVADPLNPSGLLIAYAEQCVKPVVSDFDTLLVGSTGVDYEPVPDKQVELIQWSLKHTQEVLRTPSSKGWTSRWLNVLKEEAKKGFHPALPQYGFGDPTSYRLIGDVVKETEDCGAVRHGAECFNYYFPQELDKEFLVVWDGLSNPPWMHASEPELREFLLARVADGYTFPLNPVWPIRDPAWYDVLTKLRNSKHAQQSLQAWYPAHARILEEVEFIHKAHPGCFVVAPRERADSATAPLSEDAQGCELADLVAFEVNVLVRARWKRVRVGIIMLAKRQLAEYKVTGQWSKLGPD